jgi:hypothetical protein
MAIQEEQEEQEEQKEEEDDDNDKNKKKKVGLAAASQEDLKRIVAMGQKARLVALKRMKEESNGVPLKMGPDPQPSLHHSLSCHLSLHLVPSLDS